MTYYMNNVRWVWKSVHCEQKLFTSCISSSCFCLIPKALAASASSSLSLLLAWVVIYYESKWLDWACLEFPPFHSSPICVQVRSLHNWKHVPVEKNWPYFLDGNLVEKILLLCVILIAHLCWGRTGAKGADRKTKASLALNLWASLSDSCALGGGELQRLISVLHRFMSKAFKGFQRYWTHFKTPSCLAAARWSNLLLPSNWGQLKVQKQIKLMIACFL